MSGRLILASASPRRTDLLARIGVIPDEIIPADISEEQQQQELPVDLAKRLARAKAEAIAKLNPDDYILAADTVVACGRRILPKAETEQQAKSCLGLLSGRRHRVHGGICLIEPGGKVRERLVTTAVVFKVLSDEELKNYLAGGEWHGKAGGYAIQGRAEMFVRKIIGSWSNVVGLSLFETGGLLTNAGFIETRKPT